MSGSLTLTLVNDNMKTILEGSCQLLMECIALQGKTIADTVIIGGWGPYIRHRNSHPGTRDVDILFPLDYTAEDIKSAVEPFLEAGFLLSAKHDFQLFRKYNIGKYDYIFNVDLLHPVIQRTHRCEVMDIIDLDVTINGTLAKTVQTMCIENGQAIFDPQEPLTTVLQLNGLRFRALNGAGVVVTKINSCHNLKRPRDIYDIFLSLQEGDSVREALYRLYLNNSGFQHSVDNFKARLKSSWMFYATSLHDYGVKDIDEARKVLTNIV